MVYHTGACIEDMATNWEGWGTWTRQEHITLMKNSNASLVKLGISVVPWQQNIALTVAGVNTTYRARMAEIVGWIRNAGLPVNLTVFSIPQDVNTWMGNWANKAAFQMGAGPITRESWVATLQEIATALKPDFFNPNSEPAGGNEYMPSVSYAQADIWTAWRTWAYNASHAIHAGSPNTVVLIEAVPFWAPTLIFNSSDLMNTISEPNMGYEFHVYQWDSIANNIAGLQAAIAAGDVATATSLYSNNLRAYPVDLATGMSKGLKLFCGECGNRTDQASFPMLSQIHFSLMKQWGIDYSEEALDGNSAAIAGGGGIGMLVDYGASTPVLNAVGQLWAQYNVPLTPLPPPPSQIDFTFANAYQPGTTVALSLQKIG